MKGLSEQPVTNKIWPNQAESPTHKAKPPAQLKPFRPLPIQVNLQCNNPSPLQPTYLQISCTGCEGHTPTNQNYAYLQDRVQ